MVVFDPHGIIISTPNGDMTLIAGQNIRIKPQGNVATISAQIPANTFLTNITGLISAGTNVTITGSGTALSPYVINSSGGGGGGTIGGTIAANQVAFGSGTDTITGSSGLTFDGTTLQAGASQIIKGQYSNTAGSAFINPDGSAVFGTNVVITNTGSITASNLSGTNKGDVTIGTANGLSLGVGTQVLSLALASTSATGALSSTDWNTFNGKQAAGNYITALTGDGAASGPGSAALTLATVNANVGSFGTASSVSSLTVNAKGLIIAVSNTSIQISESQVINLTTDLAGKQTTVALTTTGTSGAATFNPTTGALNIPNYAVTGGTVTSVSGTTNRITSTGGTTPVIDISAVYVGQASITTLGTIGTGSWNGTAIGPTFGGTGQTTYTLGDTLYASAANTLSKLAGNTTTAKQYLSQTGTGAVSAAPVWATISGADIPGAALTETNDTNVTMTLGGTPATALLRAASMTLGWTGTLSGTRGGTGVNNGANTITIAGNLSHAGAFTQTFTATANTSLTLPITGTLATLAGTETFTNKAGTSSTNTWFSLTTTGTSGAATYTGNTLNIPQYAGFANPMTTLGDIIYENASPSPTRLAGNITATRQFLSQTGTGAVSAAPAWAALASADIPNNAANTTGSAQTLVNTIAVSTAPQIDVSGQTGISITNGSNASIAPSGSGYYKIAIAETGVTGASAEYICGNGVCAMGASALASAKGWVASTTTPAAGDFSVAYNTGTSHYSVYNNQGATIAVKTFLVKLG